MDPLIFTWNGEAMEILPRLGKAADKRFTIGERYLLAEIEDRDMVKHRRQFAFIREAWKSLDHCHVDEPWAQSPEHLRKFALIKTGFCNTQTFVCASNAEAKRWAAQLRADDEYAIVTVQGTTIYRFTAVSQAPRAMGAQRFYESRAKVMDYVAGLIGTNAKTLSEATAHTHL